MGLSTARPVPIAKKKAMAIARISRGNISPAASNSLLADEVGLGKTIQAIAAIRLLNAEAAQTSLIVVPAGLVRQWRRQLRDWAPELKLSTVVETAEEPSKAWQTRADVFITSYESIRSDLAIRAPYGPGLLGHRRN
jgi:SNF2 family DNA or RNA helicase